MPAESGPILIIGAGAVGCSVATVLMDSGHEPVLAVRTPLNGLRRDFAGVCTEYPVKQITKPEPGYQPRWVLLCTKAYDTDAAMEWLPDQLDPQATVAVLQNGVDHVERLSQWLPSEQVMPVT